MMLNETEKPQLLPKAQATQRVQQHFDHNVSLYVKKSLACYQQASIHRLDQLEATHPQIATSPMRVLDVGCGGGKFLDLFLDRFPMSTALGIDLSREMLKENSPSSRKELRNVDALSLPADLGSFHVVNVDTLMHHLISSGSYEATIQQIKRFLISLQRVLMPGGVIMIREIYHEYQGVETFGARTIFALSCLHGPKPVVNLVRNAGICSADAGVCFLSRSQWATVFAQAGYSIVSEEENDWTSQPYRRFGFKKSGDIHYIIGRTRPRVF